MNIRTKKDLLDWNNALTSLIENKIRTAANRFDIQLPEEQWAFWKSVHKSITSIENIDIKLWARSAVWLKQNGYSVSTNRWGELQNERPN